MIAPIDVQADLDAGPVYVALHSLSDTQFDRANRRALERAVTAARTVAVNYAKQKLTLPVERIRKGLRISVRERTADVYASARPVGLVHYRARQTRGGVTFQIQRGGKRQRLRHAFLATVKAGGDGAHLGVFTRATGEKVPSSKRVKGTDRARRLPIREVFTTNLAQVMRDAPVREAMRARALEVYTTTIAAEVRFRLQRSRRATASPAAP